jgi:uncharacterized membrane protein YfcA
MEIAFVLAPLIIAVAFFGEAIFGFGGGLISIPLLSLVIGVKEAVTLVLIFQLLMGLLIIKSYRFIEWKIAGPMTISLVIGTVAGTLLLSSLSVTFLQIFLAVSILVFVAKMAWFNGFPLGKGRNQLAAATAGLGGGLFQGVIGTGGPVLTMYLSSVIKQKMNLRAILIYLLFVASIVRLAISIPQQLFTESLLQLAAVSLPFFLLAIALGQRVHEQINDRYYRLGIYVILTSSAILLLVKAM